MASVSTARESVVLGNDRTACIVACGACARTTPLVAIAPFYARIAQINLSINFFDFPLNHISIFHIVDYHMYTLRRWDDAADPCFRFSFAVDSHFVSAVLS